MNTMPEWFTVQPSQKPVEKNDWGFICTDKTLMSSVPGIFAAGDVRAGATHQAASAAGEGATVALMVREYLKEH